MLQLRVFYELKNIVSVEETLISFEKLFMNRGDFIKQSLQAGTLALLHPYIPLLSGNSNNTQKAFAENDLMKRLITANDVQVEKLLQTNLDKREFGRRIGYDINSLTASYVSMDSRYHQSAEALAAMQKLSQQLVKAQAEDGTVNIGNLESPPDTAFLVELLTAACFVLQKENAPALAETKAALKTFLLKTGEALRNGGVHTPNHRWVISAALARLNALWPSPKYTERIDEWLSEGIYINSDGAYPERSRIYSNVENTALITMARLLNRPALFEPVRKNLATTYYYIEPNGDLVTNDSRRQDQFPWRPDPSGSLTVLNYYFSYRYMALKDNNKTFAAIVKLIEGLPGFEEKIMSRALINFLEEPLLQKELPTPAMLPVTYEKLFAQSHLLRIRRDKSTTTFFGGCDQPVIIASGRSNSPDFFSFRKGEAILKYLRLSTSFFSTGYFYSDGLKKEGTSYVLHKKLTVPYYQPLPNNLRRKDGDYALSESTDGRFWNKMDFKHRPVSNVKNLDITVSLSEKNSGNELLFEITGQSGVQISIELCFKEGGTLSDVSEGNDGAYFLGNEAGQYRFGANTINFGPGALGHKSVNNLEGERYATHFGNLRTQGLHVYLTGTTPFTHKLTFS